MFKEYSADQRPVRASSPLSEGLYVSPDGYYVDEDFVVNGSHNDRRNFVVLDRLQDPGNIGTIIRTADAAGYDLVIAVKGNCRRVLLPKTVRAAAGSLFRMTRSLFVDTEEELLRFTRAAGKKLSGRKPCPAADITMRKI